MNKQRDEIIEIGNFDYNIDEDEIYHRGYIYEYMVKCDELGLENIESYTCPHSYCCDCAVGETNPPSFCVYCGNRKGANKS